MASSQEKLYPLARNSATLFFPFFTAPRWPPAGPGYFLHPSPFNHRLRFLFDLLQVSPNSHHTTSIFRSTHFLSELEGFGEYLLSNLLLLLLSLYDQEAQHWGVGQEIIPERGMRAPSVKGIRADYVPEEIGGNKQAWLVPEAHTGLEAHSPALERNSQRSLANRTLRFLLSSGPDKQGKAKSYYVNSFGFFATSARHHQSTTQYFQLLAIKDLY